MKHGCQYTLMIWTRRALTKKYSTIFEEVDDEWSLKELPSDFMLGVKTTSIYGERGVLTHIEHTMSVYVLGAAESFREHLPTRTLSDPSLKTYQSSRGGNQTQPSKRLFAGSRHDYVGCTRSFLYWKIRCANFV